MQENEFERNVQKSMESFRLSPSDTVWQNLERGLKEKKRRRFLIFFLLSTALVSGIGLAYYWMNTDAIQQEQTAEARPSLKENGENENNNKTGNISSHISGNHSKSMQKADSFSKHHFVEAGNDKQVADNSQQKLIVKEKESSIGKQVVGRAERPINQNKLATVDGQKVRAIKTKRHTEERGIELIENAEIADKNERKTIVQHVGETTENKVIEDAQPATDGVILAKDSTITDSLASIDTLLVINIEKKPVPGKKMKTRWAIEFSGGINSVHTDIFSFQQNTPSAFTANQPVFAGLPQQRLPSAKKAGASFTIGLSGEIAISARSSIVISPHYKYASERIKIGDTLSLFGNIIGTTNNTATNPEKVYQSGGNTSYTNTYHQAGVAVQYQWDVLNRKKVGLLWNAGITPLFLLSTNALVYDTAFNGVYYHDKNAFRNFTINASTGFYVKFGNTMQWAIGPQFSFQLSSLMKKAVAEPKQFQLYSGVAVRMYLPQKR